jgi:hypothetical protein
VSRRMHGENSGIGARREERKRLRPLGTWSFSKCRKKVCKLRREHSRRQIGWRRKSRTLVSTSREHQSKHTEGGYCEPLALFQKSRQLLDRKGGAWGLTLLTPGRSPDSYWDIDICHIGDSVDRKSMRFRITKSETPKGGKCHLWSQLSA